MRKFLVCAALISISQTQLSAETSVSSNPGAVDISTGTGALGRFFGIKSCTGVRLGGMWIGDVSWLVHGGIVTPPPKKLTGNSLLILDFNIDMNQFAGIQGGSFGIDYLQFNGQATNLYAGAAQGYDSLTEKPPLNRSELYELWYRQTFFDEKLIIRMGKSVPTYDFNNVIRPVPTHEKELMVPAVSGLIYSPIFVNSSILGVMPGYYNSAWGITTTIAPIETLYASYGLYDGNLAHGVQTGIKPGPTINNYHFNIFEGGTSWTWGEQEKPGMFALGAWFQTGKLTLKKISENGAHGFYLFGSQRLWFLNPGANNRGISGFYQFGFNNSKTLPFPKYVGLGLTGFALIPHRPDDSMGFGMALAWLNRRLFTHKKEVMFQWYYQMHLIKSSYFIGALSYIPTPGIPGSKPNAVALTGRLLVLF